MSVEKILESNEEMCRKLGHLSMDQGHGQNGTHDSKAFAQCKRVVIACDTIEWKICVVCSGTKKAEAGMWSVCDRVGRSRR